MHPERMAASVLHRNPQCIHVTLPRRFECCAGLEWKRVRLSNGLFLILSEVFTNWVDGGAISRSLVVDLKPSMAIRVQHYMSLMYSGFFLNTSGMMLELTAPLISCLGIGTRVYQLAHAIGALAVVL